MPPAQRAFHVRGPLCAQASIVDAVSAQMKEAMKAKDTTRLAALRNSEPPRLRPPRRA